MNPGHDLVLFWFPGVRHPKKIKARFD
jgi:hypothetical protein